MLWIPLTLLSAFLLASSDAYTKRIISKYDVYLLAWIRNVFATPYLILVIFLVKIPVTDFYFWLAIGTGLPIEILALILNLKAIKLSPLSLTMPFLGLTPVFLIFTSFIMLGELPDLPGITGILLIAIGAYLLNFSSLRNSILDPFKAVLKEKGSVLMIIVAFIYSITSNIAKIGINHSSAAFFGSVYYLLVTVLISVFYRKNILSSGNIISKNIKDLSLIGFFYGLSIVLHFIGLSLTHVAYMISVKRTSLLFSILYGKFMFHEIKIKERLLGSLLIMAGVILITLF